jgi:hypothetical protein
MAISYKSIGINVLFFHIIKKELELIVKDVKITY